MPQTVDLPIAGGSYAGLDGVELVEESAQLYDAFVNEKGSIVKRPGLEPFSELGFGGYGGIATAGGKLYAACSNRVERFSLATGTPVRDLNIAVSSFLVPPVSLAYDGTRIFVAFGSYVNYHDTTLDALFPISTSPTTSSQVAYLDGYILAIDGTNKFYFSPVNAATSAWSALDFASAAGAPDLIRALRVKKREIFLFGEQTTEIWENDGESPFSRVAGGFIERGVASPHAVVEVNERFYALSDDKRFVIVDSTGYKVIESPYDSIVQEMLVVSDCVAGKLVVGSTELVVFQFPTQNRTIVYSIKQDSWSEWGSWSSDASAYNRWPVTNIATGPNGRNYAVDQQHYTPFLISRRAYQDSYYGGLTSPIRFAKQTGWIDYGSEVRKRSERIVVRLKRGSAAATSPKLMIRWRNNGRQEWSNWREMSLGDSGDTHQFCDLRRTGIYRSRQYEFASTSAVPLVITKAWESITPLTR